MSERRKGGRNPPPRGDAWLSEDLDRLGGRKPEGEEAAREQPPVEESSAAASGADRGRVTVYAGRELLERVRMAVVVAGMKSEPYPASISDFMDRAVARELRRLERTLNEGEPFEPYRRGFAGGRPRKRRPKGKG